MGGDAGSGGIKEQGKEVAGTAAQQGKEVAGTAAQQGKEVAGTAAQQGKEVASTAVAGAQQVAGEAKREIADVARTATEEIRGLVGQVSGELRTQATSQTDRLAEGLRTLSTQLQGAASGQPLEAGPVKDLARQAGTTFEQLSSRLQSGGVDGVVQDVSTFARRKPGLFLAVRRPPASSPVACSVAPRRRASRAGRRSPEEHPGQRRQHEHRRLRDDHVPAAHQHLRTARERAGHRRRRHRRRHDRPRARRRAIQPDRGSPLMSDQYNGPDLRVEPKAPDRSLGELFAEMANEMGDLVRTEIELAKTETKEEVTKAGKAGGMFAGAGLEAYFVLLFLSLALAFLLDEWIARPLAFLIVAVLHGIVAYVLYSKGRAQMKQVQPIPQTVGSIKENT
jgi:hypothetical protein